jgi:flagellar biosynthesis/type III secretory pathway protein FliH
VSLPRGRILKAPTGAVPARLSGGVSHGLPLGRRLARAEAEAAERARLVLEAATRRASGILQDAERQAAEIRAGAVEAGRAAGLAEVAGLAITLREREARAAELALDRVVELARLLAERLLGHVLRVNPAEIASLASQTLAEAGGARRVEIRANPEDVPLLQSATSAFDPDRRVHAVIPDESLARGDLRLNTELGMIDASLGPELGRLAERLREALTP